MARINRKTEDVLEIYKKVGICPGGASVGSVDPSESRVICYKVHQQAVNRDLLEPITHFYFTVNNIVITAKNFTNNATRRRRWKIRVRR